MTTRPIYECDRCGQPFATWESLASKDTPYQPRARVGRDGGDDLCEACVIANAPKPTTVAHESGGVVVVGMEQRPPSPKPTDIDRSFVRNIVYQFDYHGLNAYEPWWPGKEAMIANGVAGDFAVPFGRDTIESLRAVLDDYERLRQIARECAEDPATVNFRVRKRLRDAVGEP